MGANVSRGAADEVQQVLDGLRRIVQSLRESSRDTQRGIGLTAAQLFVLRRLADSDCLSINELAAATFTHQSSVSVVASRLVQQKLAVSRPDPRDRRRRQLTLTPAGRRVLAKAPSSGQERLISAVIAMTPPSRRSVGRALTAMADAIARARRPAMFFEATGRS